MASTDVRQGPTATHAVINQPLPLVNYNAFDADPALGEALAREGGGWGVNRVREIGAIVASAEAQQHARRAQRNIPVLHTHDRYGNRIDEVEYDPSMHWMLRVGVEREVNSLPWREPRQGAHVVRAAMFLLFNQLDTGPCCPLSINYAATPTIRQDAALAAQWEPRLTLPDYDRFAQAGMVMTEKQGGSDLRANTTLAEPIGDGLYELTGHKWFCTHPVFEMFFTLAQTSEGITCFVAQRPDPGFRLQRLKDKLGGRCLASSEVEFDHLPARVLGEEGRGTAMMIEQLSWTRLDTLIAVAGMMRRVVAEAIWHARHRHGLRRRARRQAGDGKRAVRPRAGVRGGDDGGAADHARLRVRRSTGDRLPPARARGDEVLGLQARRPARSRGAGVPRRQRLHRGGADGPVLSRHPDRHRLGGVRQRDRARRPAGDAHRARGAAGATRGMRSRGRRRLPPRRPPRRHPDSARPAKRRRDPEWHARQVVENLALALQGSLLVRSAPPALADAFCARLAEGGRAFGTLPSGISSKEILERALAL